MDLTQSTDVAILGGGISGLACAMRLRTVAPSLGVTVIEARPRPGGKVVGTEIGRCIVDGGPDLCVEGTLAATHLYEILSLGDHMIPVNPDRLPTFRRSGESFVPTAGVITDGLVTMRRGMHDIIDRLLHALRGVTIRTSCIVRAVERANGRWRVATADGQLIESRAVLSALPAPHAGRIFGSVAPSLAHAASRVRYLPMTTVSTAWRAADIGRALDATGYVDANPEPGSVSACTWTTRKIPSRAPAGVELLRGYVRSADPDAATIMAVEDMRSSASITGQPLWTRAFAWEEALPQYPRDHAAAVAAIRAELAAIDGFAIAGAAWDGVGVGSCIASGERAADFLASAFLPRQHGLIPA